MVRIVAGILALVLAANGLVMMLAPSPWYGAVPGVTATGAFNPHFVRDIGAAYLTAGAGVGWFAWRPHEGWPALAAAAAFLTLHAAIHVYDATCGTRPLADFARDFAGVYLTAAIALVLAVRKPQES